MNFKIRIATVALAALAAVFVAGHIDAFVIIFFPWVPRLAVMFTRISACLCTSFICLVVSVLPRRLRFFGAAVGSVCHVNAVWVLLGVPSGHVAALTARSTVR